MTITKTIKIDVDADQADKDLIKVTESVDGLADSVESVGSEADKSVKATGKMAKGFDGVKTAVKGVGTAMKAAGIGLIIALFAKLAEIAGKNQKVMDLFSNTMLSLEIAFKDFYNFVASNFMPTVERVQTFFDNLTFDKIKKAIKENLIERFESLLEVVGFVGDAIKKFFSGDFDGAIQAAKEAGKEMVDVYTGVDDTVGKVSETVSNAAKSIKNYATETFAAAKAMTELNNQAVLAEAQNRGLIEQYDRQAEQLRQIRDDDLKLIEDRIEANERLGEILNEQEQIMLRNAELTIQAARNQLKLNNNIENQVALQDALNEKAGIQAQIEGFRSEQLVNTNSLLRERDEIDKQYYDDIDEMMDADIEANDKRLEEEFNTNQKAADEKMKLNQAVENAKLDLVNTTSNLIRMIAGEDSKVAKGVAVAQATISGFEAVQNTFKTASASPVTTLFPAYPFIKAGLAGAFSALQVKKILSTDPSKGGGGARGGATSGGASAPRFNLVQGSGSNQIAEGINREAPIAKAYVVSSDVSSSQELDRKIVQGASL